MGLLLGLVGFRALGSLVQSGDENDLVLRDCIPLLFQVATIYTQNPSDISLLEEHWVQRYKLWYDVQCPSGVDALDDASAPPSALCQQMMEMGFPREWCDVALLKCSYQVEAAINFCFEHSSDMDRLVKQPTARSTGRAPSPPTSSTSTRPDVSPILLEQLMIKDFRTGTVWVLICTDLMSRGIDFKGVNMVINYDFPQVHLRTIANVMKLSGCDVPAWMLNLKKASTRQRKQLLKAPPERYRIETVSGYDLQKANKRRLMKAKADGTAAADDATADE
ncbi:hypothetical protein DYB31_003182 [Aphanomyces astaci]|uniref:UBA domain-containing protein n=1 Tax=Aphanomyces astaci TaxID=112090 RepID=A0A397EEL2_APHAT|nr:hypothetical protein DYB31_003182 [Aphanomyces astaci]